MAEPKLADGARAIGKFIALSIVVLVALNLVLSFVCREILLESSFRLSRAAAGNIQADILVVGNSRGVNLLDGSAKGPPRIFNLSYNGLPITSVLALAKDFYKSGNTAPHLVIEASGLLDASAHCEVKSYWPVLPMLSRATRPQCPTDAAIARFFPLTIYDSEMFQRAIYYLVVPSARDQAWANNYRMTRAACAHPPVAILAKMARTGQAIDVQQARRQIDDLKSWLRTNGHHVTISFVLAPFQPSPGATPYIADIRNAASAVLGKGGFLDLSASLPPDCDLFSDELHISRMARQDIRARVVAYALEQDKPESSAPVGQP